MEWDRPIKLVVDKTLGYVYFMDREHPLGDKKGYMSVASNALTIYETVSVRMMSRYFVKHDNEMIALAEAWTPVEEVVAIVRPRIEQAFLRAKKNHSPVGTARQSMWFAVCGFLNRHYYDLPQQERVFKEWSRDLLKGYQKWWRRVEKERKRLQRRSAKTGIIHLNGSRDLALRIVSPELFKDSE